MHRLQNIIQFIRDDNRLSVVVEDNWRGFNTESTDEAAHAGIETVKESCKLSQWKTHHRFPKGIGTTVMMDFLINGRSGELRAESCEFKVANPLTP
jgi:nitrate/nitrite-specific signal transduction histidine kinase